MDYTVNKIGVQILIEADPTAIKQQVVEQYKEMRKNKKLSQEQVASVAGMARPDISRFESGRYNPSLEQSSFFARIIFRTHVEYRKSYPIFQNNVYTMQQNATLTK